MTPAFLQGLTANQVNDALLLAAHQTLSRAQPGSQQHTLATSALHKLRLEACRRTGNLGVQHARAVFPNY